MSSPLYGIRAQFDTLRTLAFGAISGTYAAIGTAFTENPHLIIVQNTTDALLTFSFDSSNSTGQFVLPANGQLVIDLFSNAGKAMIFSFKKGDTLYVKGSPGSGSVYLSLIYARVN